MKISGSCHCLLMLKMRHGAISHPFGYGRPGLRFGKVSGAGEWITDRSIGVATAKLLVRNDSTHHLSSAIVLQHSMGPAARAKIGKSPGLRPLFPKAIHDGIFLLTVPFL